MLPRIYITLYIVVDDPLLTFIFLCNALYKFLTIPRSDKHIRKNTAKCQFKQIVKRTDKNWYKDLRRISKMSVFCFAKNTLYNYVPSKWNPPWGGEEGFETGDFNEKRQQEVLVGANLLLLIRINRYSLCQCQRSDST